MAGGAADNPNLKGLSRIFNAETNFGRANCAKATYALIGVFIAYKMLKPKPKPEAK
ncbi:ATP synthase membrane subunit K, mitochondrial [Sitodiplosis mosellana]|uniref:ATP synthase membrane subunit K, mitochondrial n=1 Tax=Sitodiplosis mosellana TaxID=263140 RepID=UPI0024442CBD|nr:ATP synthase membrane subunit K, mitochondrial [Sitodiplosis mosellana]